MIFSNSQFAKIEGARRLLSFQNGVGWLVDLMLVCGDNFERTVGVLVVGKVVYGREKGFPPTLGDAVGWPVGSLVVGGAVI